MQEYNLQGSVARLPDLNIGRYGHACGHYTHNGQLVSTIVTLRFYVVSHVSSQLPVSVFSLLWCLVQVFIVTGGQDTSDSLLSSTEVLTPGTSAWQQTGHLPSPRHCLAGVSIGGNFIVTGEQ